MTWKTREQANAYAREYRLRNLDKERAKARERYAKNPGRYRHLEKRWRETHVELRQAQHRRQSLKRRGITELDYDLLAESQDGLCAICGKHRSLDIDHDHACHDQGQEACAECIRGLLCRSCNGHLAWYERNWLTVERHLRSRPLSEEAA